MASNGTAATNTAAREPTREPTREHTAMLPFETRSASNAILATSGVPKIFPATASEYCTAAYYGDAKKLDAAAHNEDTWKSGFAYVDGDSGNPAGLFYVKKGKRDATALHDKPFTLISLKALADSSDDTTLKYALPPVYYARAAGQRDALLALSKHAADEQPDAKTNTIYTVTLDMTHKKWVVDRTAAPLRRSAFEVAVENGFEKGHVGDDMGCRGCEASSCTLM